MKARPSTALIGMFVAGAIGLAAAGVFYFEARTWLGDTSRVVVYFDESVHGLDVGAPVKFRGVRVGRVREIGIHYDPLSQRSIVPVIFEIDRQVIRDAEGRPVDIGNPDVMRELVSDGLRARLTLVGISGLMFIELDYVDPAAPPRTVPAPEDPPYAVVPAVPSMFADLRERFTGIAANIGEVDFAGIAGKVENLLEHAESKIGGLETERLASNLNEATEAFIELIRSEGIQGSIDSANTAFSDLSSMLRRLDEQVDPVSERFIVTADELSATLGQLGSAVEAMEGLISPRSGLGPELATTLQRLGEASRSVQRLADFLERNPNALLSGRQEVRQ